VRVDDMTQPEVPDCHRELANFLDSIGLIKCLTRFVEHGFQDVESLRELQDSHLDKMQFPLGYKLKILKKVKEATSNPRHSSMRQSMQVHDMDKLLSTTQDLNEMLRSSQKNIKVSSKY